MSKTKTKKPQREVILNTANTLYKQIKNAWTKAPRGSELEGAYAALYKMVGELCDKCEEYLRHGMNPVVENDENDTDEIEE